MNNSCTRSENLKRCEKNCKFVSGERNKKITIQRTNCMYKYEWCLMWLRRLGSFENNKILRNPYKFLSFLIHFRCKM